MPMHQDPLLVDSLMKPDGKQVMLENLELILLVPGKLCSKMQFVGFKLISKVDIYGISCEISFG